MKISRAYLYLAVLVAGCATLGVEISAAHLLRVVYGTADLVWASVIGLMLLYLTAGYQLGGRWADRHPHPAVFNRLLLWAAFTAGLAAVATRLLLRPAAAAMASVSIGPAIGSFVAAMALLAVPVLLLGCVSPFAVRLALGAAGGSGGAGQAAGRIYAASTLGSFVGTFLPPLLLVPLLGARLSYWALAGTLLLVALIGLAGQLSLSWAVLVTGLVSLGAEVAANRLLGPVFGTSNLVWAAVIGVNMAALAIGYFAGGRLADRFPDLQTFFILLGVAAATAAIAPLSAGPTLELTGRLAPDSPAGFFLAVTTTAAILFGLPVALMGCATPFALRLLLPDSSRAGATAGALYAISTAGSLLGAFLPVLWLIPAVGAAGALLSLAIVLALVALFWLLRQGERRDRALLLPLLGLLALLPFSQGPLKTTPGQLFEAESPYNYIEVVEREGVRYLLLNEGQGVHSIYDPADPLTRGTWDLFLTAPFFNAPPHRLEDVRSLALVGLAAGTISKQYTAAFGPIPIDGIEIDPAIVAAGRDYFAMNESNLNIIIGDGRYELQRGEGRYDVIGVDAYRLPYIPWHLTTREFFQELQSHLNERGVVVINVGRTETDHRMVEAMTATLETVFPTVHVMDVPGTFNSILVATLQPTAAENLAQNLALLDDSAPQLLRDALAYAERALGPTIASEVVFTDDRAPVEMMTNQIVIDFVLSGSADTLGGPIGD
jgi:spermidine synthase